MLLLMLRRRAGQSDDGEGLAMTSRGPLAM